MSGPRCARFVNSGVSVFVIFGYDLGNCKPAGFAGRSQANQIGGRQPVTLWSDIVHTTAWSL
jgi:hypothetical protein